MLVILHDVWACHTQLHICFIIVSNILIIVDLAEVLNGLA